MTTGYKRYLEKRLEKIEREAAEECMEQGLSEAMFARNEILDDIKWMEVDKNSLPSISWRSLPAGGVHVYRTKTGRWERDFMKGWREFDLGKFAVSSVRVFNSDTGIPCSTRA